MKQAARVDAASYGSANNAWLLTPNSNTTNFRNVNNDGTPNNNNANNSYLPAARSSRLSGNDEQVSPGLKAVPISQQKGRPSCP